MEKINEIIEQLHLFSKGICILHSRLLDNSTIDKFQKEYNIVLPKDYLDFVNIHNGFSIMGIVLYGVNDGTGLYSIEKAYAFEHFEVENPMPDYLVPFSPDGLGNHFCFDLREQSAGSSRIVFWQHDIFYTENDPPEVVCDSFLEWIKHDVIDFILTDYSYTGEPR